MKRLESTNAMQVHETASATCTTYVMFPHQVDYNSVNKEAHYLSINNEFDALIYETPGNLLMRK